MDVRKGHPDFLVTWKDASLFTSSHDSMTVMTLGGPSGRVEDRSGPFWYMEDQKEMLLQVQTSKCGIPVNSGFPAAS